MKQLTLLFILCVIIGCTPVSKGNIDQLTADTATFTIPEKYAGKLDSMLVDSCDAIILERWIEDLPTNGPYGSSLVYVKDIILNKTNYDIPDTLELFYYLDEYGASAGIPSDSDRVLYLSIFMESDGEVAWTYIYDIYKTQYRNHFNIPSIHIGEEFEEHKREEEVKKQKRDRDLYHPFTPPPPE